MLQLEFCLRQCLSLSSVCPCIQAAEEAEDDRPPSCLDAVEDALDASCQELAVIDAALDQAEAENLSHPAVAALEQKRDSLLDDQDAAAAAAAAPAAAAATAADAEKQSDDDDPFAALDDFVAKAAATPADLLSEDVGEWLAGQNLAELEGVMRENLVGAAAVGHPHCRLLRSVPFCLQLLTDTLVTGGTAGRLALAGAIRAGDGQGARCGQKGG
eukprot:SAG22_NODE_1353_length_4639_cov_4.851101_2_plen_215_part_00